MTKLRLIAATATVALALPVAAFAAYQFDFSQLKIFDQIKPGLWQHTSSSTPQLPFMKPTNDTGCVSAQDIAQMLTEGTTGPQSDLACPMEIKMDTPSTARLVAKCPPMEIAQLGITSPAADIPYVIEKQPNADIFTVTATLPGITGGGSQTAIRHEFTRLGACTR
ncbi:DUF3617 domain-containing protein [Asticcacaulis endophyticus]|uniref:DUF3617 family protein n=1 Tax=Asticcacaulis endophyticus TaxID=1395890 RepID=A0A918UU79_9CAUL|nr:hypothetical protein [Asticcacaulis endophyticus]GGZ34616.1 hypothetical protein GCM10011273_21320 [Asticcacaulis endophyticus]